MARVTVEDCIDKVDNRFELVLLASHRARQISQGSQITIDRDNDKNPVVALREIADEMGKGATMVVYAGFNHCPWCNAILNDFNDILDERGITAAYIETRKNPEWTNNMDIDDYDVFVERFGEWLKKETGNAGDSGFVNAFVTASLTVCIGAMAIVGAIQDGILGDYSTLAVKSVLDFIIIAVMTSSMGKGCAFSAIPVFLFEGSVTLLARLLSPVMTELAISYLSLISSVLIFCVGLNLVFGKKTRVANMLPAVLLAVLAAYPPWKF